MARLYTPLNLVFLLFRHKTDSEHHQHVNGKWNGSQAWRKNELIMFVFMLPDIWKTQNTVEQNVETSFYVQSDSIWFSGPFRTAEICPLKMCSYHVAHLKWNKTHKMHAKKRIWKDVFWSVESSRCLCSDGNQSLGKTPCRWKKQFSQ